MLAVLLRDYATYHDSTSPIQLMVYLHAHRVVCERVISKAVTLYLNLYAVSYIATASGPLSGSDPHKVRPCVKSGSRARDNMGLDRGPFHEHLGSHSNFSVLSWLWLYLIPSCTQPKLTVLDFGLVLAVQVADLSCVKETCLR